MLSLSTLNQYSVSKKTKKLRVLLLKQKLYFMYVCNSFLHYKYFAFFLNLNSSILKNYCKINNLQYIYLNKYFISYLRYKGYNFLVGDKSVVLCNNLKTFFYFINYVCINLHIGGLIFYLEDSCYSINNLLYLFSILKLHNFKKVSLIKEVLKLCSLSIRYLILKLKVFLTIIK
jgi:hypothetical protein